MVGIINLCKPAGMTSHDAVNAVRRLCGQRRVGHAGTLDPGACGVLPIFLGWATKLAPYIDHVKAYRAEMTLGITTDSQDAAGKTQDVTECAVSPYDLGDACAFFLGSIDQIPPMTSAIRIGGKHLYELAREGETVERPARKTEIYSLHIKRIWPADATVLNLGTRVLFDVECAAGTYVRTLCADIGAKLGCGAYMSFLVRTRSAGCRLAEAVTLEELTAAAAAGKLAEMVQPADYVLQHLPSVTVDDHYSEYVLSGRPFPASVPADAGASYRVYNAEGDLLALASASETTGWLQPARVFLPTPGQVEEA